jgi:hypothetical protein
MPATSPMLRIERDAVSSKQSDTQVMDAGGTQDDTARLVPDEAMGRPGTSSDRSLDR